MFLNGVILLTQAQKQAESLLARHEVQPLEKAQVNELDAIMKAAEQELVRA